MKIVDEDLGAKIENIGFNEDWTITIEMFPEVNIHMSYSYFGDEFGDSVDEAEFKFYFSGQRVYWVPGEDSATFIDIVMDFIEGRIKNKTPFEKEYDSPKKAELHVIIDCLYRAAGRTLFKQEYEFTEWIADLL